MLVRIDPSSPEPLHAQIARSVRRAVLAGELARGERLPSARDLADSLGINMHTVLRGYATVRDDGLIELRRGRGAVVTGRDCAEEVDELIRALIDTARKHGLSPADLCHRITKEARA